MLPVIKNSEGKTMQPLHEQQCQHDESSRQPLPAEERDALLAQLPEWEVVNGGKGIRRTFVFKNYYHTMSFVNAVAWIANKEAHHPDLEVSYNRCVVTYTTHDMDALGRNDLICAAKIDQLLNVGQFGPKEISSE